MVSGWQAQGTPLWLSTPQAPGTGEVMAFSHPMEVLFPFFFCLQGGTGASQICHQGGKGWFAQGVHACPFSARSLLFFRWLFQSAQLAVSPAPALQGSASQLSTAC